MRKSATLIAVAAFASAAALSAALAIFAAGAVETRAQRQIDRLLAREGMTWAAARVDGLSVTLTGIAPTEALRFRAVSLAGSVVPGAGVTDAMAVVPAASAAPPDFLLELLRNDDGVSLIGLVPADWNTAALTAAAAAAAGEAAVADMLQTADHPVPEGWDAAVAYGLAALAMLPRSKISVGPGRVTVTAIADSAAQKRRLETDLARAAPGGDTPLKLAIEIAAPRPVITPFTLRFVIDDAGARFDACSAASERGRARIVAAGVAAGAQGKIDCALGLGAPSPRWADAAVAAIRALAQAGAGTVTLSDTDVTLIAAHTTDAAVFERAIGDLRAALPEVFSLSAQRTDPPQTERAAPAASFTATLAEDGALDLRGRIADDRLNAVTEAFARARFGAGAVTNALRIDPEGLPDGWSVRVLAGLAALAELDHGAVLVEPGRVALTGTSGNPDARSEAARILAGQLGQGAAYTVDVTYDPARDPRANRPAPEACVAEANAVLARGKIAFAPGSADIPAEARRTMEDLAAVLRSCPDTAIEIGGHTDSQGRAETNLMLSERRAEAVRNALRSLRVPVGTITARGYGAEQPIADNATEAGREANRRIALRLVEPATAFDGGHASAAGEGAAVAAGEADGGSPAPEPEVEAASVAADPGAAPRPVERPGGAPAAPIISGVLRGADAPAAAAAPSASPEADAGADAGPSFAPRISTMRPQRRPGADVGPVDRSDGPAEATAAAAAAAAPGPAAARPLAGPAPEPAAVAASAETPAAAAPPDAAPDAAADDAGPAPAPDTAAGAATE